MDISKKSTQIILIFLLFFQFGIAQTVDVKINYQNGDDFAKILIVPHSIVENTPIQLQKNIDSLKMYSIAFSKEIDLLAKDSISYRLKWESFINKESQAVIVDGGITIVQWNEIIFQGNDNLIINVLFSLNNSTIFNESKRLFEWHKETSVIAPDTCLRYSQNNINFISNAWNESINDLVKVSTEDFIFLKEKQAVDIVLINSQDSLPNFAWQNNGLIVIYTDELWETPFSKESILQQTILHELFHVVSPYQIHPYEDTYLIDKNWMAEAYPEYLALHYRLSNQLISDREFMDWMAYKLSDSQTWDNISLVDLSIGIYTNPSYRDAFYSKGCLSLFMTDLMLRYESDFTITFFDVIRGDLQTMDEKFQQEMYELLMLIDSEYVQSTKSLDWNNFLPEFGWVFEQKRIVDYNASQQEASIQYGNFIWNKMNSTEQIQQWNRYKAKL